MYMLDKALAAGARSVPRTLRCLLPDNENSQSPAGDCSLARGWLLVSHIALLTETTAAMRALVLDDKYRAAMGLCSIDGTRIV